MERRLFLTGLSGCGKTTMIRKALGSALASAGGFVTERVLRADGSVEGYDLYPAAAAAGVEGYAPARFLDYSTTPPSKDNEVFRGTAVRLLGEAQLYPFAVVDEFGGYEMLIPEFCTALGELFSSGTPCIGVLKGSKNAGELKRTFSLGGRYNARLDAMRRALDADADTLVLEISGWTDTVAIETVRRWTEEYAR